MWILGDRAGRGGLDRPARSGSARARSLGLPRSGALHSGRRAGASTGSGALPVAGHRPRAPATVHGSHWATLSGRAILCRVKVWLRLWVAVALMSVVGGCRSPEPRSPDVVRQKAAEPPEPSIFDQLPLAAEQRASVNDLIAQARLDLATYDECRLALLDEIVVEVRRGQFDRKKLD